MFQRFRSYRFFGLLLVLLLVGLASLFLWSEYHLRAAQRALEDHRPRKAQEHLRLYQRVRPATARFHLLAARAARLAGDYEEAGRHLQACQDREGERPSDESVLEWALLKAESGHLDSVEDYLKARVLKNDPQTPRILEATAEGYLRVYRFLEAMACLEKLLEREPDNVRGLYCRGQAWERVHAYEKAAEDYRRVVELRPEHDKVRLQLANALLESNRHEEAVRHLELLRQRQPHNPEVLVRLAFGHNNLGDSGQARQILEELLAEHPDFAPALMARGQLILHSDEGDPAEAERWLRQALAKSPYDRQTHFLLYEALQRQGKEDEARAQQVKLKQVEKTIERLNEISNRLMPQRPHDPDLHCELGTLMLQLGHEEMGLRWLHSALEQKPDHGPAHAALADYYERTGDAQQAAYHRQRAGS